MLLYSKIISIISSTILVWLNSKTLFLASVSSIYHCFSNFSTILNFPLFSRWLKTSLISCCLVSMNSSSSDFRVSDVSFCSDSSQNNKNGWLLIFLARLIKLRSSLCKTSKLHFLLFINICCLNFIIIIIWGVDGSQKTVYSLFWLQFSWRLYHFFSPSQYVRLDQYA